MNPAEFDALIGRADAHLSISHHYLIHELRDALLAKDHVVKQLMAALRKACDVADEIARISIAEDGKRGQ